jgi:hypothetical protein
VLSFLRSTGPYEHTAPDVHALALLFASPIDPCFAPTPSIHTPEDRLCHFRHSVPYDSASHTHAVQMTSSSYS